MFGINSSAITPKELKKRLDSGENVPVLDVREPHELAICKLDDVLHIPMSQLQERLTELEPYRGQDIVVLCRSGARSSQCVQFMRQQGYRAINLKGGILAWSDDVDPTVTKY
jgi:adenylyltransferase/sulfurtransferase